MNTAKDYIHKLIDELSEKELPEVLDYIEYIKAKKNKRKLPKFARSKPIKYGILR